MKLGTLVLLQGIYCLLGITYNGVSQCLVTMGERPLTPTTPVLGIIVMMVYGLFLIPGYRKAVIPYRTLMGIAVIILGYGGVVTHIINVLSRPALYSSLAAWAVAVVINLFGLALNVIAVSGKFE
jgi:hypothetical protein